MTKPLPPDVPRDPGGRPSKYDERFCEEVEARMAEGYSLTAFAGLIGVNKDTLVEWTKAHPEFSDAVSRAKAKRLAAWEGFGIGIAAKGAGGPGGASMVTFALKNMGGDEWSDTSKVELTGKDGGPIQSEHTADEAFLAVAAALGGYAARPASSAGDDGLLEGEGENGSAHS